MGEATKLQRCETSTRIEAESQARREARTQAISFRHNVARHGTDVTSFRSRRARPRDLGHRNMTLRGRELAPEARAQITKIRAAARKGLGATEIAELCQFPIAVVNRVLAPANHGRLSNPAEILTLRTVPNGHAAADVQLYWVGFLTAAGRISGQGPSMAVVVTLGDRAEKHMTKFMEDITGPRVRQEYCQSSLLGWQVYVREPSLCHALMPWGIPSDFHGEDPALLDDIPNDLIAPFLAGYLDGNWPASTFPRSGRLTLHGTPDVLSAVNRVLRRCWGISEGKITLQPPRATLRYPTQRVDQQIWDRVRQHASRKRQLA